MEDDVPIVVRICCHVIEQRLEQDGTGIYRRNGNKPIVDQLEDEMNKNIETMKSDHELMKGQGQICYFLPLLHPQGNPLELTLAVPSFYPHVTLTLPYPTSPHAHPILNHLL